MIVNEERPEMEPTSDTEIETFYSPKGEAST